MTTEPRPYDPLDPEQRLERGRERSAFFRQTDMFPLAVMAMAAFVVIAIWHKPWAIPFLGWMLFMPFALGLIVRDIGERRDLPRLAAAGGLQTTAMAIVLFVALALVHNSAVWVFAAMVVAYLTIRFLAAWLSDIRSGR